MSSFQIYSIQDLPQIVQAVSDRFKKIKLKYPKVDAYPVFSGREGQCRIFESLPEILFNVPSMFIDSEIKKELLSQVKTGKKLELLMLQANKEESKKIKENLLLIKSILDAKAPLLQINGDTRAELRFNELDFEIIKSLRTDALIDTKLTPQIGGIRIVLGTLEKLLTRDSI